MQASVCSLLMLRLKMFLTFTVFLVTCRSLQFYRFAWFWPCHEWSFARCKGLRAIVQGAKKQRSLLYASWVFTHDSIML